MLIEIMDKTNQAQAFPFLVSGGQLPLLGLYSIVSSKHEKLLIKRHQASLFRTRPRDTQGILTINFQGMAVLPSLLGHPLLSFVVSWRELYLLSHNDVHILILVYRRIPEHTAKIY